MTKPTILVAEDDNSVRLVISQTLSADGFAVKATASIEALMKWVRAGHGDAIVTDVYLDDNSIFDSMAAIRMERPDLPIIVMSGQNTILTAATAAEEGAFDYLPKPFDIEQLSNLVSRALKKSSAGVRRIDRETRTAERNADLPMIGGSQRMQEVYRTISRVMNTDLPILIEGESGTGKEVTARAIHDLSQRSASPFIYLDIEGVDLREAAALLDAVPENEQCTVYIDEIGGVSLDVQARLIHKLRDYRNARLIVSTSADLERSIQEGTFRQDLYYRINIVHLTLPALRDRSEDIPELASAFLIMARDQGLPERRLDQRSLDLLSAHKWPGNVRELQNTIFRLCVMGADAQISSDDVKAALHFRLADKSASETDLSEHLTGLLQSFVMPRLIDALDKEDNDIYQSVMSELEKPLISLALEVTSGNKVKAAALLGLNRNTLRAKINSLNIAVE